MDNTWKIKFWGVRGSHAVPGTQTVKVGGNTACVQVQAGAHTLILDAGTGIINLGHSLLLRSRQQAHPVEAALFFSHLHHDHIQGFPFFAPAYVPGTRLHLFAWGGQEKILETTLAGNMQPPVFPVPFHELAATRHFYSLSQGCQVLLGPNQGQVALAGQGQHPTGEPPPPGTVRVRVHRSAAHPGGSLAFRIEFEGKALVYATDIEGYEVLDRKLVAFSQRADVLIHDAQYTDEHYYGLVPGGPASQGWGHSTVRMACNLAQAAAVSKLFLFHHDPGYDDKAIAANEDLACQLFPNSQAAVEGLEVALGREKDRATAHNFAANEVQFQPSYPEYNPYPRDEDNGPLPTRSRND